jgi:hypothetical protein
MSERLPRLSGNGVERQRALEVTRLAEVKGYIGYQSHLYSRTVPDQKEDIAQVAREAVIRQLRTAPDCPISHLKVRAKSAILNYRKVGSSVDGKLDESDRARHYDTLSLDAPISENDDTRWEEVLGDNVHYSAERSTEEQALNRVWLADLRSRLSELENQVLKMRLQGVSWQNITRSLGHNAGDYCGPVRRRLEAVARQVLTPETPVSNGKTPLDQK